MWVHKLELACLVACPSVRSTVYDRYISSPHDVVNVVNIITSAGSSRLQHAPHIPLQLLHSLVCSGLLLALLFSLVCQGVLQNAR